MGETALVPDAPYVHVFQVEAAGKLEAGDEARLTVAGARRLAAESAQGTEVLIWESDATGEE